MSTAVADLHTESRVFTSSGQALFFYVEEFARRVGIRAALEWGSIPMPDVARAEREATYARVVAALRVTDPEDYSFDPPLTTERLEALVCWYMTDEAGSAASRLLARFAGHLGLRSATWPAFCRECRRTRNMLRRRLEARGLVRTAAEQGLGT